MRLALLGLAALAGCSAVDYHYLQQGYAASDAKAVKRIAVTAWAETPEQSKLAAQVATDLIRLHTNYLAYDPVAPTKSFVEACEEREGVLVVRLLEVHTDQQSVALQASTELYRCSDGRMMWRTEGDTVVDSDDSNLVQLTGTYSGAFGDTAKQFAAPFFALLKDLLGLLPNPTLSEDEVLEKIELG